MIKYNPHDIIREARDDGAILLRSARKLGPVAEKTSVWLEHWAKTTPQAVFLAERSGAGWRTLSYGEAVGQVKAVGAALAGMGLNSETPILILSGNSIDHGILVLAAQYVGIACVPVAEQYSLIDAAHPRLVEIIDMVRPKMAFAVDGTKYAKVLALPELNGMIKVCSDPGDSGAMTFSDLLKGDCGVDLGTIHTRTGPDTVAKILMTSGSTSSPKGVLTTQRMMCTNQAQLAGALPFLTARPPVIIDWLPWNHVFGGSHNFNMILANGGSLYIDDGKPAPGLFNRTRENLSMVSGTVSFNVPVGFGLLLDALKEDEALRKRYFPELDMIFYAGASLPQAVFGGLRAMAIAECGEAPLVNTSWGLTETAPGVLLQHEPTDQSGIVGVPLDGVELKLIPDDGMRCEVRVKGPNITPGYFENPEKTAEAFDEEGYFLTGDAMLFVDKNNPNKGLRFDGRISEDFKLLTGTWVRAANLRLDMLGALAPLAADVIITGHDRNEIGVLIMPNRDAIAALDPVEDNGLIRGNELLNAIGEKILACTQAGAGSSTRIARAAVLAEPAQIADGEVTAKGNLNFRKLLTRRAALLERLYSKDDAAVVRLEKTA